MCLFCFHFLQSSFTGYKILVDSIFFRTLTLQLHCLLANLLMRSHLLIWLGFSWVYDSSCFLYFQDCLFYFDFDILAVMCLNGYFIVFILLSWLCRINNFLKFGKYSALFLSFFSPSLYSSTTMHDGKCFWCLWYSTVLR